MQKEELLKRYDGEWILLFDEEIIDHSVQVDEILRLADEQFPQDSPGRDHIRITKVHSGIAHVIL